jgi:hypothetical protein
VVGHITGGEITHRQKATLDHREKIVGTVSEIENIPEQINGDYFPEFFFERLFKMNGGEAMCRVGWRIAT